MDISHLCVVVVVLVRGIKLEWQVETLTIDMQYARGRPGISLHINFITGLRTTAVAA